LELALKTIIITDIFGQTDALIALAKTLNADEIIDPYQGTFHAFHSEQLAYQFFMQQVGISRYTQIIHQQLAGLSQVNIIAFSVGASALWCTLGTPLSDSINQATCFYGAQIRGFTEVEPRCKTTLVFPFKEPHFDVSALHQRLLSKKNVTSVQVPYLHGFMNRYSVHYDHQAYQAQMKRLLISKAMPQNDTLTSLSQ